MPTNQLNKELLNRLDTLAAYMHTTGEHLWRVLIRESYIEGVTDLAVLLGAVVGIIWVFRQFERVAGVENGPGCYDNLNKELRYLGLTLLMATLVMIGWVVGCSIPGEFLNPEYFALSKLLKLAVK